MPALIFGAVALLLVGFGGGWGLKGWKDGAEVTLVNSQKDAIKVRNDVLVSENAQCVIDIEGVRNGVAVVTDALAEREKAASAAMKQADVSVAKHKAAMAAIKALPPVPPEQQCAVIEQEQVEYVQKRKVGYE
ncbi:hypothetical protein [Nitrosospira sp. Nsp13]|uniref:hypothetical protein n=1 Tax=Nitrosospira sp. Nsp13 TaxID=1855332 RepID=UPI000883222E|nr:hypothetical protein [Nitrosospira sp. Nsp13]SCX77179.1 hypothetical protein SAMN05216308_10196 [Nitrosospira sp. Nsp13]